MSFFICIFFPGAVQIHDSLFVANHFAGVEIKMLEQLNFWDETSGAVIKNSVFVADHVNNLQSSKTAIVMPLADGLRLTDNKFINWKDYATSRKKRGGGGSVDKGTNVFTGAVIDGTSGDHNGAFTVKTSGTTFHDSDNRYQAYPTSVICFSLIIWLTIV